MDKECYLRVRVTPEMLKTLQELADADSRTLSNYVRLILSNHISQKGIERPSAQNQSRK